MEGRRATVRRAPGPARGVPAVRPRSLTLTLTLALTLTLTSACGPARVAISSSTAEVRSSKLPVASGVRYPMAWRKLEYSAASKGAGFRACHASISLCE